MIGTLRPERLTCTAEHLPGCYNPHGRAGEDGCTACICGAVWWPGKVGTWHSRQVREPVTEYTVTGKPITPPTLAWNTYFLHTDDCAGRSLPPHFGHLCHDVQGIAAGEFWGQP